MPVTSLELIDPANSGSNPVPSYDGHRLAYFSGSQLIVHSDIGPAQAFALDAGTYGQLQFARDGSKVVFTYTPTGGTAVLRIVDLTTGTVSEPQLPNRALGEANNASFSSDGTRIVFATSQALSGNDTNGLSDIYMLNLSDGSLVYISTTALGNPGNRGSFNPTFSPNGFSVAFESDSTNLVSGDTNNVRDVFLKTWTTGAVSRLSVPNAGSGTQFTRASHDPVWSKDGSFVMFQVDLANGLHDVYYKTPGATTTTTVMTNTSATNFDTSYDTSQITYVQGGHVFVRTLNNGATQQVDVTPSGTVGNGQAFAPRFTAEGAVVYASTSSNLLGGDTSGDSDIYLARTSERYSFTLGTTSDDTLNGTDFRNDILDGGAGADTMAGGLGSDTYIVDNSGDVVVENNNSGLEFSAIDRVVTSVSYALSTSADIEELLAGDRASVVALDLTGSNTNNGIYGNDGINILRGLAGNDSLFGFRGNDEIYGGIGNDYLVGGLGFDLLVGGTGDDAYVLDDGADTIIELAGEGFDTVYATFSFGLPGGQEVEMLSTGSASTLTAALSFTGNEFDNILYANEGANTLQGGEGNDSLFGLGGADSLLGGNGADRLYSGSGADALLGGDGNDELYGEAHNDSLDGGLGADFMAGGLHDDSYFVDNAGDAIRELAGQGFDRVFATISYTLTAGAEVEILSAGGSDPNAAIDLTGNEYGNNVYGNEGANVLRGGDGVDWLFGFGGNDTLYGDAGNDFLIAGAGTDTLYGGLGNDVLQLDDAADVAIEAVSAGYDRVYVNFSYSLGAGNEIEELTTGGNAELTTALDLTGNEFGQIISANDGVNVIDGGGGADRLFGFGGDDTLIGGTGVDRLYGGAGSDTLTGGFDGDFFFFDASVSSGVDTITDFVSGEDVVMLSTSQFAGIAEGSFPARAFTTGTSATDPSHRIIYDSATGHVLFDQDGAGGAAAVHFLSVTPGTTLTAADFVGY